MERHSPPRGTMTRRIFILGTASAVPLAYLGYWSYTARYDELVFQTVRRTLPDLTIDPDGLRAFARDFTTRYRKGRLRVLMIALALRAQSVPFLDAVRSRLRPFAELTTELFLMSSDYFVRGRDGSAPVKYIGFYDPYERPCTNFLAVLE